MRHQKLILPALVLLVSAISLIWFFRPSAPSLPRPKTAHAASPVFTPDPIAQGVKTSAPAPDLFAEAEFLLSATREEREAHVANLRKILRGMDPKTTADALLAFLRSGVDAPTNETFVVGRGGNLDGAPTLRLFALDLLGQIDPRQAAVYAAELLPSVTRPDEWALALRNYGRHVGTDAFLTGQTQRGLSKDTWARHPTTGYLEGFDAAAFVARPEVVDDLLRLATGDYPAQTASAATLALQRSVASNFAETAPALVSSAGLASNPRLRADLLSHADLRRAEEMEIVASHLADPSVSAMEGQWLINSLPQANERIADTLLTRPEPKPLNALLDEDLHTLAAFQQWEQDPKYALRRPALKTAIAHLRRSVADAAPFYAP